MPPVAITGTNDRSTRRLEDLDRVESIHVGRCCLSPLFDIDVEH